MTSPVLLRRPGDHDRIDLTPAEEQAFYEIAEEARREPEFLPWLYDWHRPVFDTYAQLVRQLHTALRTRQWRDGAARPEQLLPGTPGAASDRTDWRVWLLMGGRGSGKSRSAAEALKELIVGREWRHELPRIALVSTTLASARVDMVEQQLLDILDDEIIRYNRSTVELWLRNGAYLQGFGSDAPRRLRGPNFHAAWADEPAAWTDAKKPPSEIDSTWSNLELAVRKDDGGLWVPRIIASTTPKSVPLLRVRDPDSEHYPGLVDDPDVVQSNLRTADNADNLADGFKKRTIGRWAGTRLALQELEGILLDVSEHALFVHETIDKNRRRLYDLTGPAGLGLTIVAVDPSVGDGSGDECGIVVAGRSPDGREAWILEDATVRGLPDVWARAVATAARSWGAAYVVAEANQGYELVRNAIAHVAPNLPVRLVKAKDGKATRAEPVSLLVDQGRVKFVGRFPLLEAQLTTWEPTAGDASPDRLDAFVYAVLELLPPFAARAEIEVDVAAAFEATR